MSGVCAVASPRERRRARNAKRGARTREPPLEAREKVAHAHAAIIAGDLDAATELLKEAVRLAPNFADPYEVGRREGRGSGRD